MAWSFRNVFFALAVVGTLLLGQRNSHAADPPNPAPVVHVKFATGDTETGQLNTGEKFFLDKPDTLKKVNSTLRKMEFTRRAAGKASDLTIDAPKGAQVFLILESSDATADTRKLVTSAGWVWHCFLYTGPGTPGTKFDVYGKTCTEPIHFTIPANGTTSVAVTATELEVVQPPSGKQPAQGAAVSPVEPPPEVKMPALFDLRGSVGVPAWLHIEPRVMANADGIGGGEICTSAQNLASHDFVFTALVKFGKEEDRNGIQVGIGDVNDDTGRDQEHCIWIWIDDPRKGGKCTLEFGRGRSVPGLKLGSIGAGLGPHLVQISKTGGILTASILPDYNADYTGSLKEGSFKPLATQSTDLKTTGSFLKDANGRLFVECGKGSLAAIGLTIDGKAQPFPEAAPGVATDEKPPALMSLAGDAGLPQWLTASPDALANPTGIASGLLRSVEKDLNNKNFTFDMVYEFTGDKREDLEVGLGEDGHDGSSLSNSALCRISTPSTGGELHITAHEHNNDMRSMGKVGDDPGPHLFRMQKRGNTLTMSVCVDYKDKFKPTFSLTIPNLSYASPFLTELNSRIFIQCGSATVKSVGLVVDGQSAQPAPVVTDNNPDSSESSADKLPMISLKGDAGIPGWLLAGPAALADADGITPADLRTVDRDLIDKDFTFDFLCRFKAADRSIVAGLGGGEDDEQAIGCRIDSPQSGGHLFMFNQRKIGEIEIGKTGDDPSPSMLRIRKHGHTLTIAVCVDFKGGDFKPTFTKTIPDLTTDTLLNSTNSGIVLSGEGTVVAVRMTINGKPASEVIAAPAPPAANTTPVNTSPPQVAMQHLISLAGPRLPNFFAPVAGLGFSHGGLVPDDKVFTVDRDFIDKKDFCLEVAYHFAADDHGEMLVGIGENSRDNWAIANSVCARIHGAANNNGACDLTISKKADIEMGHVGDNTGPMIVRLQKHANTLTLAVGVNFNGDFKPLLSRTIPDLSASAPFLTATNSPLFLGGKGGVIEKMRLSIDGKFVESSDPPANLKESVPSSQPVAGPVNAITKLDDHRIQLPPGSSSYTPGIDGHLLLLAGDQLAILNSDGFTIAKQVKLPKAYTVIGERKNYYVAVCQEPRSIDIIDKTSLKVIRSRMIAFSRLDELQLNPTMAVSYVSYFQRGRTGLNHFLVFEEVNGEARLDDTWTGAMLTISSDGTFLLAATNQEANRYDLDASSGYPVAVARREGLTGGISSIRLSPDNQRASFLSAQGYPMQSEDIGAWKPTDLSLLPVEYATKGIASAQDLAFHPTLPLVVCHGKSALVFFDRESGEKLESRVDADELAGLLTDQTIERTLFSPDGKSVILQTANGPIHSLCHVPLKLSADELKQVGEPPHADKPLKPYVNDGPPPKLNVLQARAGGVPFVGG